MRVICCHETGGRPSGLPDFESNIGIHLPYEGTVSYREGCRRTHGVANNNKPFISFGPNKAHACSLYTGATHEKVQSDAMGGKKGRDQ